MPFFDMSKLTEMIEGGDELFSDNLYVEDEQEMLNVLMDKINAQKWCLGIFDSQAKAADLRGQGTIMANSSSAQNTTGSASSKNTKVAGSTGANAAVVWNTLTQIHGFTPEAAAGVIGNLTQESGVQPNMTQRGGGPGRGMMQWTVTERWAQLVKWAEKQSRDPWALDVQIDYMILEMKAYRSKGQSVYEQIKVMKNIEAATYFFEVTMERAGKPNMPNRYKYAAEAYKAFASIYDGRGQVDGSLKYKG